LDPGKCPPPPSVRTIHPAVPAALDRICTRAIAQDLGDRYASARSLADDLDQWLLEHRGGKIRLSFPVTTIILGLAAALLLVIGIRAAVAPWNDATRSAASANPAGGASPVASAAPSSDQPRPLLDVPSSVQLIGNPSKGRYHRSTCPTIKSMIPSNKVVLRDADEARAAGLQPCAVCHPPVGLAQQQKNDSR